MRRSLLGLSGLLLLLVIAGTSYISTLTPSVHAALMQQIADSGLAQDQDVAFESGWLKARSKGRIRLASSLCASCQVLDYQGTVHHGLGAWLMGDLALVSADYEMLLPELPLEPALPPLKLHAQRGLSAALIARLNMPASAHRYRSPSHTYLFAQGGIAGKLKPGQLDMQAPALSLSRDENLWFTASQLSIQAAAENSLEIVGQAALLDVPAWHWVGHKLRLQYRQEGMQEDLSFKLNLNLDSGRIGQQQAHASAQATLHVERLNLVATRAFVQELPRLLADSTSSAARMLGLFSLYSVHGPDFFSSEPALGLDISAFPLVNGQADVAIKLAVVPGTRRPPMHPLEWQRALQGQVDVRAPRDRLLTWWENISSFISPIVGLPRSYAELMQQGWVQVGEDGRDRLYFELNPVLGPQRAK